MAGQAEVGLLLGRSSTAKYCSTSPGAASSEIAPRGRSTFACSRIFAHVHTSIDDFVMPSPERVAAYAVRLRLLGDPVRLTICCALVQGETNPSCLAELAGVPVQGVSQHLGKLRLSGVVRARRDGQRVWYELVDAQIRDLVRELLAAPGSHTGAPAPAAAAAAGTEARA
jgi:DNA-binding transcriptional ArsR family regulator